MVSEVISNVRLRNEADVKALTKVYLEKYDIHFFMPLMAGYGRDGIPDFICCVGGQYVSIEAKYDCIKHRLNGGKTNTGAPTPFQKREMASIRKHGGITLVVDRGNVLSLPPVLSTLIHCCLETPQVIADNINKIDVDKILYFIE